MPYSNNSSNAAKYRLFIFVVLLQSSWIRYKLERYFIVSFVLDWAAVCLLENISVVLCAPPTFPLAVGWDQVLLLLL